MTTSRHGRCSLPDVEGFYVDVGWGTYGFKGLPVSGEAMAQCIADGRAPEIIEAFGLGRFGAASRGGEGGGRGWALNLRAWARQVTP